MKQLALAYRRPTGTNAPLLGTKVVAGFFLLLTGTACGKSEAKATVVLTVMAAPAMPSVSQLQVVWTNGASFGSESIPQTKAGTPLLFDSPVVTTLSGSWSGQLDLSVSALDATATVVASGTAIVDIIPGGSAGTTIQLAVPPPDAGSPDDTADDPLDTGTTQVVQVLDGGSDLDNPPAADAL